MLYGSDLIYVINMDQMSKKHVEKIEKKFKLSKLRRICLLDLVQYQS